MEKIVFNANEVAELLGVKPLTIYRGVKKGLIPAVKMGRTLLFPKKVIEEWLEERAARSYKEGLERKGGWKIAEEIPTFSMGKINEKLIKRKTIYGDYLSNRH